MRFIHSNDGPFVQESGDEVEQRSEVEAAKSFFYRGYHVIFYIRFIHSTEGPFAQESEGRDSTDGYPEFEAG